MKEMNANAWKVNFFLRCFPISLGGKMQCSALDKTTLNTRKKILIRTQLLSSTNVIFFLKKKFKNMCSMIMDV